MKEETEMTFEELQQEVLRRFKEIGIEGKIGRPHLQRDNASLVIPNKDGEKKYILK